MEQMNSMGGHRYNDVKDGFRNVIQSDMQLNPEDCGAPVVDLDGHVDDSSVKGALDELSFYTEKLQVLGVYPKHSYRNQ